MKYLALLLLFMCSCQKPSPVAPKPTVAAVVGSNTKTRESIVKSREKIHATQDSIETGNQQLKTLDETLNDLLNNH